jgi:hypothetical protein
MNSVEDPKIAAERLMQRAYNRDGLPELTIGLAWLAMASLVYGAEAIPKGSPAFVADILGFAFGCPLLTIGAPRFVKWVRGRYLTGRLGYVRPKRRERAPLGHRVLLAIATGCVVFCVVFLGDLLFKNRNQWILALVGLFGGAIQIGFGWRYGVKRFVVTGLFLALFGAALSLTGLRLGIAMAAWLGAAGLVEFVTGGVVLLRFLAESEATEGSGGN